MLAYDMKRYLFVWIFELIYLFVIVVTGPQSGSLGALFVLVDWQVRVFWSYGLIDIPSDRL